MDGSLLLRRTEAGEYRMNPEKRHGLQIHSSLAKFFRLFPHAYMILAFAGNSGL